MHGMEVLIQRKTSKYVPLASFFFIFFFHADQFKILIFSRKSLNLLIMSTSNSNWFLVLLPSDGYAYHHLYHMGCDQKKLFGCKISVACSSTYILFLVVRTCWHACISKPLASVSLSSTVCVSSTYMLTCWHVNMYMLFFEQLYVHVDIHV